MKKIFVLLLACVPTIALSQLPENVAFTDFYTHYTDVANSLVGLASKITFINEVRDDIQTLQTALASTAEDKLATAGLCFFPGGELTDDEINRRIETLEDLKTSYMEDWAITDADLE